MKNIFKNLFIEINGFFLYVFFFITRIFYKIQANLLKDEYPQNHNIYFELDGVVIKESSKSNFMSGALNNYTAQQMVLEENKRYNNYTVSLEIPFKNKNKAYRAYDFLKDKFKKDLEIKNLID